MASSVIVMNPPKQESALFQKLPDAVVENIARLSDRRTVCVLRLTCKRISKLATHHFCDAYMADRRHVVSRYSLNALVAITAHKTIGPYVRNIYLGSSRACIPKRRIVWAGHKGCDSKCHDCSLGSTHQLPAGEPGPACSPGCAHTVPSEQEQLDWGVDGLALLQTALMNVRKHGNTVVLGSWVNIVEDTMRTFRDQRVRWHRYGPDCKYVISGWGHFKQHRAIRAREWSQLGFVDESSTATIRMLLRATNAGITGPRSLDLGVSGRENDLQDGNYAFRLQRLRVHLCQETGLAKHSFSNLTWVLKHSSDLEALQVNFGRVWQGMPEVSPSALLEAAITKKLETLYLIHFTLESPESFIHFLERQKSTLRSVLFSDCTMRNGTWTPVFTWMLTHLTLDHISVESLVNSVRLDENGPWELIPTLSKGTHDGYQGPQVIACMEEVVRRTKLATTGEAIQKLAELRSEKKRKADEERRARPSWSALELSALPQGLYRPEPQVETGTIMSIFNFFFPA